MTDTLSRSTTQERRIVTAIPGSRSVESPAPRPAAVASGVGGNPVAAATASSIAAFAAWDGVILLTAVAFGNILRSLRTLPISDELPTEAIGVLDDAVAAL